MDKALAAEVFTRPARDALEAFPIEPQSLDLVAVSENVTFRVVDATDQAAYVLRLHRPGYHSLDELVSERIWIGALADDGIAVPHALAARDGRDYVSVAVPAIGQQRFAGVSRWTEGRVLADVLQDVGDTQAVEGYFEQLGTIAAAMHNQDRKSVV